MKKYRLAIASMVMMAVVQHVGAQDYFASASDYARLYVGAVEAQYPKALWHELPYYKGDTKMYRGRISYHGVVYENVLMRFDQLKQCVVVVPPREGCFVCRSRSLWTGLRWMAAGLCMIRRMAQGIRRC